MVSLVPHHTAFFIEDILIAVAAVRHGDKCAVVYSIIFNNGVCRICAGVQVECIIIVVVASLFSDTPAFIVFDGIGIDSLYDRRFLYVRLQGNIYPRGGRGVSHIIIYRRVHIDTAVF